MPKLLPWMLLALLLTVSGQTGCPPSLTSADVLAPGPFAVGFLTASLEDAERGRALPSLVWYPAAPGGASWPDAAAEGVAIDRSRGRRPAIVYSHGFGSFKEEGSYLASHLASHGYVVIAADFPFTGLTAPGGPDLFDVVNQPGDVSFLIDTLLAWNREPGHPLFWGIDRHRIGLAGLSFGGLTTLLATFHPDLRDPRVRAALAIAPLADFFGPAFYENARVPLMLVFSDLDAIVDFEGSAATARASATPPFHFVTLFGASHTGWANIAALLFEGLSNPDLIGCGALVGSIPEDPEEIDFEALLGGEDAGLIEPSSRPACSYGLQLETSIRPSRQHQLTILAALPFFDAHLARGPGALRSHLFLTHTLEEENAGEIAVETVPYAPGRRR